MSPAELKVLLHYYVSPEPHPDAHLPWIKEVSDQWVTKGILKKTATGYDTTDRGNAWCHFICETPMPEQIWVDPRTQEKK